MAEHDVIWTKQPIFNLLESLNIGKKKQIYQMSEWHR